MTNDDPEVLEKKDAIWKAILAHRERADSVLPTGDSDAIKAMYVELGSLLESAADGDPDVLPVLSYPENAPTVASLASGMRGLVLDAGCGPNPVLSVLLGAGSERRMVCADIGLGMVRLARAQAASVGVDVLGVVVDVEALPFRDGVFGGVVCEDTIEHLPDDGSGVEELARVLDRGGRAILATPNRVRLDVLRDRWRDLRKGVRKPRESYYASNSHLREYTWGEFQSLAQRSFRIVRRAAVGWSGGWRAQLATALVSKWPFRWVGRMIVLEVEPRRR